MPLPSAAQAAPRVCLHCDDDFVPARKGWRAVYCSDDCRRANNGGTVERRAQPLAAVPDPKLLADPPDPHAPLDRSARQDFERLREQLDDARQVPPWRLDCLVAVGREWCERCEADYDAYVVREPA